MKTKSLFFPSLIFAVMMCSTVNVAATNYFVKLTGSGSNGSSWDDAISSESFVDKLKNDEFNTGDIVYFAGGTYTFCTEVFDTIQIKKGITLIGGFDPSSTGAQTSISYPTENETIISGDLNKDNTASEGDAFRLLTITSPDKVTIKGITFQHAYYSGTVNDGPGAIYTQDTEVDLSYCKIRNNKSGYYGGGAGLSLKSSTVFCHRCLFKGNSAPSRGGSIRVMGSTTDVAGVIILDQCLVTENSTTTNYGGAVQLSSTESGMSYMNKAFIINTTITENYCGEKGGGAVSVSAGQAFLLISSTIANNPSVDLSQGSNIRLDTKTGAHFYLVNSICVDKDANKNAVCIGANKGNVVSGGGNFVGGYLTTSSAASWLDTDESDKSYTAVFGTNELADNGGFTQTILPVVAGKLDGSEIAIIGNRWLALNDIEADITQDQRGYIRSEGTYALGAYDPASVSGLKKLENSNKIHVFPTITTNVVSVSDAVGKTVRLINMQGAILKTIVCQSDLEVIDMSEFTKGIYLLNIDSEAVKVVLQ